MDEKQFNQILDAVSAQTAAVNALAEKFTTRAAAAPAQQFETVNQTLNTLVEKLTALETRMEGKKPGTETPETTQPAEGADEIL